MPSLAECQEKYDEISAILLAAKSDFSISNARKREISEEFKAMHRELLAASKAAALASSSKQAACVQQTSEEEENVVISEPKDGNMPVDEVRTNSETQKKPPN